MLKENCLHIGSIFKLHGYKGNIILYNENDYSFDFKKINHLFIDIDKILVPFFIERISVHKTKNFLIKLGIKQRAEIISKNLPFSKKADIFYRLKRLIDDKQMGDHFKVMLIKNKNIKFDLGF